MNSTKITEAENDLLESIQVAIWIIAGLAICALILCVWRFIDTIIGAVSCLCRILTCCCRSSGYRQVED